MTVWDIIWLTWLAVFLAFEGYALHSRKPGDTLSEQVWKWFAIGKERPTTGLVRLRRFTLLAFMAWLTVHFLTGGLF